MALAFETITVAGVAIGFTQATWTPTGKPGASTAVVTVETAQVRFRVDGTDPTAALGHVLEPGDQLHLFDPDDLRKFRAIRTGGISATLSVTFR